jgi:hypothetical protein
MLQLQRLVGNQAVTAGVMRGRGGDHTLLLHRQAGNRAVTGTVQRLREHGGSRPVQRGPTDVLTEPASEEVGSGPSMQRVIDEQVNALPPVEDGPLVEPEQATRAQEQVDAARDDVQELGGVDNDSVRPWVEKDVGAGGEDVKPVVEEIQGSQGDLDLPAPTKPSLGSRIKSGVGRAFGWMGGKLSSGGKWIGKQASDAGSAIKTSFQTAFGREGRRDKGALGQAVAGIAVPVGGHGASVMNAGQQVVDNPATQGAAKLVDGAGAAQKVGHVGESVGRAQSAAAGGLEIAHHVAAVVGPFFAAIKAALDIRSVVSTMRVIKGLKEAKRTALQSGASPRLVEAVDYAIRQKYEKVIKKALGAAVALAALGVGLAILIANPVGAALAALIIGGLGAGVFLYKLGRWLWKKRPGEKRNDMAKRLYHQMRTGDVVALDAIRALHLDPNQLRASGRGPELIARKLKSA